MGTLADYAVDRELPGAPGETCFEATHRVLPRRARVRVARDRVTGLRLMREACIREALHHPGIARIYETGVADGMPWIADELVEGVALGAPLAAADLASVLRDICTILAYVHRRGVIHDGIWLDAIVKAPDRGYALCLTNWTRARAGTPSDGHEDIHALGMAIYAALPGTAPRGLIDLVDSMESPNAAARPSAVEIAAKAARLDIRPDDPEIEDVILLTDLSRDPELELTLDDVEPEPIMKPLLPRARGTRSLPPPIPNAAISIPNLPALPKPRWTLAADAAPTRPSATQLARLKLG